MTAAAPHPGRWAGLGVLSLSLLIVVMDMTILNVALPELGREVQPTSIELLWIVDVYALVVAGLLVTASALGDRIGRRSVLLVGYAVFAVASALVLVADSPGALIAVRALLGIGGAMIMPSTLSMIRTMFTDPRERGVALGVWAAMAGVGGAIGPIVGGALLEAFSWHAAFLVNVPFMLVALAAGLAFLPESRPDRPARIDAPAVLLSIAGAASLMYAIKSLGKHGLEPVPVALAILAVILLAAFVRRSLRRPEPMLDVRLLASRRFRGGVVAALSSMVAMGGLLLLGVQWLQLAEGLSPLESGIGMLPMALTSVVSSLVVPGLAERFGQREAIAGGLLVAAIGMAVPVLAPGDLTVAALAVAFAIVGLGMGSLSVASGVIMSGTPVEKAGSAAALEETSYELGQALSVAVLGSIGLAVYRAGLPAEAGNAARESLTGAVAQSEIAARAVDAFTDGLLVAGVVGAVVLGVAAAAAWHLVGAPSEARAADAAALSAAGG